MRGGLVTSGAQDEFREFADIVDTPVCDHFMGKGAIEGTNARYTGMIGMHGTKASNFGVTRCDLLLLLVQDLVIELLVIQIALHRCKNYTY